METDNRIPIDLRHIIQIISKELEGKENSLSAANTKATQTKTI